MEHILSLIIGEMQIISREKKSKVLKGDFEYARIYRLQQ